jgi:hypothetical protein
MGDARRYASNCRDDPVRCNFADQAVGRVRDEEVSASSDIDIKGPLKLGARRKSASPAILYVPLPDRIEMLSFGENF